MLVRPPEEMEECCVCAHLTPFIITMCKDGHRCCPACARQYFETNLGSLRYLESASRFTFNCFCAFRAPGSRAPRRVSVLALTITAGAQGAIARCRWTTSIG